MRQLLKADLAHMRQHIGLARHNPGGVLAVFLYRLATGLYQRGLKDLGRIVTFLNQLLTGAELDPRSHIGPGLLIHHPSGVVVGPVVAGRDLQLYAGIVLGGRGVGDPPKWGYPRLGDRVGVYAKASVLGPVTVGDDASIGPHALVMHNVPAGVAVHGVRSNSDLHLTSAD